MLKTLLGHKILNRLIMLGMLVVVLICIRPPDILILKRIASHSTQIMVLFLLVGLFFLMLDQRRLLFTAFGCSAALCLYFKNVANISLILPIKTTAPTLTVLQSSASELGEDWKASLQQVQSQDADVVCFLELTPNWEEQLKSHFGVRYPNRAELTRVDFYGLAIYSKYQISDVDTIYFEDIPTLKADILLDADICVSLFVSNTSPPLFRKSFEQLRSQLELIADQTQSNNKAVLTVGNYNLDQFSEELQDFRAQANLSDSRKTMSPSLNPPTNHIFYNDHLECLSFVNVYDLLNARIGIKGEYQLKRPPLPLVGRAK